MDVKYITQLTKDDLSKMLSAGNMKAGRGIEIKNKDGAMHISLDVNVITDIIWCFIRSGMASCAVTRTIMNTRGRYKTDPNTY